MAEYIERDSVLKAIDEIYEPVLPNFPLSVTLNQIDIALGTIPAADVAPVRHGRWIPISDGDGAECSECGDYWDVGNGKVDFNLFCSIHKFCSNCGARMDL